MKLDYFLNDKRKKGGKNVIVVNVKRERERKTNLPLTADFFSDRTIKKR